jgi:hypothetical protein
MNGFTVANLSNLTKTIAPGAPGGGQATGIVRPGGGMGGPVPSSATPSSTSSAFSIS